MSRRRRLSLIALVLAAAALLLPPGAAAREWPSWLGRCGETRLCGTFTVPLDRTDPSSGTIGLNVVVVPAVDEQKRQPDAITAIAGGPGGASTEMAGWAQTTFFLAAETRDLVLADQRGTGKSKPLFCPSPELLTHASTPDRIRAYWTSCLGTLGADPRLFTTSIAMDDLDDLRAALGYPQLNVYGGSYGATAAQYYLLRHGDRVRTAILDSGTLLDIPIFERWARVNQSMLDQLFARCAVQRACHKAFPSPAADLRTILGRLDRNPVTIRGQVVGRDEVAQAIQYLSRDPATAAKLPLILRKAARSGIGSIVADVEGSMPDTGPSLSVMSFGIRCLEPWARATEAEVARLGTGSYLGPTTVRSARFGAAVCSAMPPFTDVAGADRRVPSLVPALAFVGKQDPQDPLGNIVGITKVMPNARIIVVRGAGHGAVDHGCASVLADRFVRTGSATGLDTSCAAKAPLTPFVLH